MKVPFRFIVCGCALTLLVGSAPVSARPLSHPAPCAPRIWPTVQFGDDDATNFRVTIVQYLLRARSFSVPVTGHFRAQTRQAVRNFQASRGLSVTGVVSSRTWEKLIVPIRQGSSGNAVRAAQTVLHDVAEPVVAIDGQFGSQTKAATKAFQQDASLFVDGVIGPVTWLALTRDFFD